MKHLFSWTNLLRLSIFAALAAVLFLPIGLATAEVVRTGDGDGQPIPEVPAAMMPLLMAGGAYVVYRLRNRKIA